jgi:hypothetical protein
MECRPSQNRDKADDKANPRPLPFCQSFARGQGDHSIMNKAILFLILLLPTGCETVYHHNTVYQYDAVHDTAESEDDDIEFYCDERLCNKQK